MALNQIDLKRQSENQTLNWEKLELDFLNGSDFNLTNGNNDATITGLKNGVSANDAVNYQQLMTLVTGRAWKAPVRVLSDGDTTLTGIQTIDGVSLVAGDRIACFSQTTTTQDGVYEVASGAWTRVDDWTSGTDA